MWIVALALRRPYTFIVMALVIIIGARWRLDATEINHEQVHPSAGQIVQQ